ncbi:MAG: hypothetical protein JNJ52_05745 [Flavobacterium sp.]|nr:hypothetical protein [Flavobacterium sp.]
MKKEDYSKYSIEDLIKKEKTAKVATIALGALIVMQFFPCLYLTYKQGFNVFTVLPFTFLPLLMVNILTLKKIKAEMNSRNKAS